MESNYLTIRSIRKLLAPIAESQSHMFRIRSNVIMPTSTSDTVHIDSARMFQPEYGASGSVL